jgi:hypothetical protein
LAGDQGLLAAVGLLVQFGQFEGLHWLDLPVLDHDQGDIA